MTCFMEFPAIRGYTEQEYYFFFFHLQEFERYDIHFFLKFLLLAFLFLSSIFSYCIISFYSIYKDFLF